MDILDTYSTFSIIYVSLFLFGAYRCYLYFDAFGPGRVITVFYSLILSASFFRALVFLWQLSGYDVLYTNNLFCKHTIGCLSYLLAFILRSLGSIFIFSVFLLIVCYWNHMLREVSNDRIDRRDSWRSHLSFGALQLFIIAFASLFGLYSILWLAFAASVIDSVTLSLCDSVIIIVLSVSLLTGLSLLSYRIRNVLMMIGAIKATSTIPQVRRIVAITIAANAFFLFQICNELCLSIQIYFLRHGLLPISAQIWQIHALVKYSTEIAVLFGELVISTAIKAYTSKPTRGHMTAPAGGVTENGAISTPSRVRTVMKQGNKRASSGEEDLVAASKNEISDDNSNGASVEVKVSNSFTRSSRGIADFFGGIFATPSPFASRMAYYQSHTAIDADEMSPLRRMQPKIEDQVNV